VFRPRWQADQLVRSVLIVSLLVLVAGAAPAVAAPDAGRATHVVQLRSGVTAKQADAVVRRAGGRVLGRLGIIHAVEAWLPRGAPAAVRADSRIAAVSVNAGVRPQSYDPGDLLLTTYPTSVRASRSWSLATGEGVGVAVIDTGIDGTHPDFRGDYGTSRIVASAVTNPDATNATDTFGHGTHVAGIIAGDSYRRWWRDPLRGRYMGIAPEAELVSIKADDGVGNATIIDVIRGLEFAVEHREDLGIRVVNLSLESSVAESYRTSPLDAAVEAAYQSGIVVVAAAGNRGRVESAADYPPGNDPFAITVGALDEGGTTSRSDDSPTSWSSAGTSEDGVAKPDVYAPGAHIAAPLARDSAFASMCPDCIENGAYLRAGGTSMSAPVVSGLVALMLELHPDWTPDQVKSTLISTSRPVNGGVSEVHALGALLTDVPAEGANAGIAPSELIDPSTGAIDPARSSWGRSSWGSADGELAAPWARSSWGCLCEPADGDPAADALRSSWGRSSWGMATWSTIWEE
jgi:serine protease AprX